MEKESKHGIAINHIIRQLPIASKQQLL